MGERCETCQFMERDLQLGSKHLGKDGKCHRYPRIERKRIKDWCGEYQEALPHA